LTKTEILFTGVSPIIAIDDNRLMRYSNSVFTKDSPFWDRTLGGRDNLNENQCNEIFKNCSSPALPLFGQHNI
jgi:hypothetical protein